MNTQLFTRAVSQGSFVLDWRNWAYGLLGGAIGGAATAGSAWLGMTAAKAVGMDVPALNWKALGVILLSGALTNTFLYLKQSPLPAKEPEDIQPPSPRPSPPGEGGGGG
jgi:hypothetical protein